MNESPKIKTAFVIIGKIGSGKSTLASFISNTYNIPVASFGAYVEHYCENHGLSIDRRNLQKTGEELVNKNTGKFIHDVINFSQKNSSKIIFDGVRHKTILEEIKRISENTLCIFVDADIKIRYERYLNRNKDSDSVKNFEEFVKNDSHPMEKEVNNLKNFCDIVIDSTQEYTASNKQSLDKYLLES